MNRTQQFTYLRSKPVLITIVVALVVMLIWLVAFFLPQGSKASKLNAQVQKLNQQVSQQNAKLTLLRKTSKATPQLLAMLAQYQGYVPSQPDVLSGPSPFIDLIDATATKTGIKLSSISPGSVTAIPGLAFAGIPVTVSVQGTYDSLLSFIKAMYALPRLTSINTISVTGGGPNTNRSTSLAASLDMQIYTTAKPTTG